MAGAVQPQVLRFYVLADDRPFRGGRTVGAAGVPGQPNVFYIGVNQRRGLEDDRFWPHVEADLRRSADRLDRHLAVAPSNPDIIYVGSGEGLQRPRSVRRRRDIQIHDGGKTWTHLGLRDGQQIPAIASTPTIPTVSIVAVLGHPYGPNAERGVFRSHGWRQDLEKVLYKDENTGAVGWRSIRQSANRLCRALVVAAGAMGERGLAGDEQRHCSNLPTAAPPGVR